MKQALQTHPYRSRNLWRNYNELVLHLIRGSARTSGIHSEIRTQSDWPIFSRWPIFSCFVSR